MTTGLVFDIQHFSVHDGPGIRTTVFLKGCPLACRWCCNPESQAIRPELRHREARCRRCLSCVRACKKGGALAIDGVPVLDRDICDECGEMSCTGACPEGALLVAGRVMTAGEAVREVEADAEFYRNSGGGATFSGGEPFRQHLFLREVLDRLKADGIHTAVETCGFGDGASILELEPLLDLVFYDLKIADPALHRRLTGTDNSLILENLSRLAAAARRKVVLRFPLIPGVTDGHANVESIAGIAAGMGIGLASIVPYHPMGLPKYAELGRRCKVSPRQVALEDLEAVFSTFESAGMKCELA